MKHGVLKGDFSGPVLIPKPHFLMGGPIPIYEHETYRLDGYKESIIEFLVDQKNRDRVFTFKKGQGFADTNLNVLIGKMDNGPKKPTDMMVYNVKKLGSKIATGAMSDIFMALGSAGNTAVEIAVNTMGGAAVAYSLSGYAAPIYDLRAEVTALGARTMYQNPVFRQIHHAFHTRIAVSLLGRVSGSKARARVCIDTGSTGISFGALAVLIDKFAK